VGTGRETRHQFVCPVEQKTKKQGVSQEVKRMAKLGSVLKVASDLGALEEFMKDPELGEP
jgi:hypothetical protein